MPSFPLSLNMVQWICEYCEYMRSKGWGSCKEEVVLVLWVLRKIGAREPLFWNWSISIQLELADFGDNSDVVGLEAPIHDVLVGVIIGKSLMAGGISTVSSKIVHLSKHILTVDVVLEKVWFSGLTHFVIGGVCVLQVRSEVLVLIV